ncbi:MAG: NUDIX domain-containing protein [Sphingomicrobium sp.]
MAAPTSAGVLLFRRCDRGLEVLLIRPGGPFWKNRDAGSWMIPKGQIEPGESAIEAAVREFQEETGTSLAHVPFALCRVRQAGGKTVDAFALEGDLDVNSIQSAEFEFEWPRRSGRKQMVPEVEEARWFTIAFAREMMLPSQLPMLDALESKLSG